MITAHNRARLAVLRYLRQVREEHGLRPEWNLDDEVVQRTQVPKLRVLSAIDFLDSFGLITPRYGTRAFVITDEGLDSLSEWEARAGRIEKLNEIELLEPRLRGKGLEGVLADALRAQGWKCREDTGCPGEQIDFVVTGGGHYFICECKWEQPAIQPKVGDQMVGRLARRPPFVVGVIFSLSGFTDNAEKLAVRSASQHVVLLIGDEETRGIITGDVSFADSVEHRLEKLVAEP